MTPVAFFLDIGLHECLGHGLQSKLAGGEFYKFSIDLFNPSFAWSYGEKWEFHLEGILLNLLTGFLALYLSPKCKRPTKRLFLEIFATLSILGALSYLFADTLTPSLAYGDPTQFYQHFQWSKRAQFLMGLAAFVAFVPLGIYHGIRLLRTASTIIPLPTFRSRFFLACIPGLVLVSQARYFSKKTAPSLLMVALGLCLALGAFAILSRWNPPKIHLYGYLKKSTVVLWVLAGLGITYITVAWTSKGIRVPGSLSEEENWKQKRKAAKEVRARGMYKFIMTALQEKDPKIHVPNALTFLQLRKGHPAWLCKSLESLLHFHSRYALPLVLHEWKKSKNPSEKEYLLHIATRIYQKLPEPSPQVASYLHRFIRQYPLPPISKIWLEARLQPIEKLMQGLHHKDKLVRCASSQQLPILTNANHGIITLQMSAAEEKKIIMAWKAWWKRGHSQTISQKR